MKKLIALILVGVMVGIVVGIVVGVGIGLHAPKWVEEHPGYYIICSDFLGNVYEDVADKEGEHVKNAHASSIYWK